ncbi:MAG: GNAT family N-acetyltransferase [Candidatus Cryptobacteroides sp.]
MNQAWRRKEAADLAEALSNPKVQDTLRDGLPYPYVEEDALEYIDAMLSSDPEETFAFAIELDGRAAVSIGAFRQGNIHRRTAEVDYYVGEKYWGRGIMTAALGQLCEHIFTHTDIIRLYAEPDILGFLEITEF